MTKGSGPGGKHENMRTYTPEEAQMVMDLVEAHAPRWTLIAKLISDATGCTRTAASVRNYHKRFRTSKAIAESGVGVKKLNKCQICGQVKRGHICRPASLTYVTPTNEESGVMQATAPAESLLALSSAREEPMLPLAPASLEVVDTPGTSPLSTFSTVGPLSCSSLFALGTPTTVSAGAMPFMGEAGAAPFAFSRVPTAYVVDDVGEEIRSTEEDVETEDCVRAAADLRCLPVAECEVQEVWPTAAA